MNLRFPSGAAFRVLLIILAAIITWIPGYLRRDLWEPDEARYALIANEMLADGYRYVPHRNGIAYADKPPLMFWLMQAGACITGGRVDGLSARLPSLLGVILTLLAIYSLATRWDGQRTGWLAMVTTATMLLVWKQAHWAQMDMLLCGLQMTGLCLLFRAEDMNDYRSAMAAFICFGLGILTKGPVGLLVPVGIIVTVHLVNRDAIALRRPHWLWGPFLSLAFPAIWLWLAYREGADMSFVVESVVTQNVSRLFGGLGHERSVFYFLPYLALDALPWIAFLPAAVIVLRRDEASTRVLRTGLGWAAFVIAFFSLSSSKRNLYILLAYPALAMVVAALWRRLQRDRLRSGLVGVGLVAAALLGPSLVLPFLPLPMAPDVTAWVMAPVAIIGASGMLAMLFAYVHEGLSKRLFALLSGTVMLLYWTASIHVLPAFNDLKTPRELIPLTEAHVPEEQPILLYRTHGEIYSYYTHRRGLTEYVEDDLWKRMREQNAGLLVVEERHWKTLDTNAMMRVGQPFHFRMGGKDLVALPFDVMTDRPASARTEAPGR